MNEYIIVNEDGEQVRGSITYTDREIAEMDARNWNDQVRDDNPYSVETVEQNEETNDDTSDTTMNDDSYDFLASSTDNDQTKQTVDDKWNWGLGNHNSGPDETASLIDSINATMDSLDETVDEDVMNVLQDTRDLVSDASLSQFECPHEDCGLGHHHSDEKHDIRSSPDSNFIPGFNISDAFAERMKFVPYCHCGANEAAMLVKYFPYFTEPMFQDQRLFEGVLELEPEVLERVYRIFNEEDVSVSVACGRVASERGEAESEVVPLGLREDLKAFLDRRQQIEMQAEKAPIGQETRSAIEQARNQIENQLQG